MRAMTNEILIGINGIVPEGISETSLIFLKSLCAVSFRCSANLT